MAIILHLSAFPRCQIGDFQSVIIHCSQNVLKKPKPSQFIFKSLSFDSRMIFSEKLHLMPEKSDLIDCWGSGVANLRERNGKWKNSDIGRTSRAVYGAIHEAITNCSDPYSGGAPQLIGMYRYQLPKTFGIIHDSKLFFNGMSLDDCNSLDNLEWRNGLFEICDWRTKGRKLNAQIHAKPEKV